MVGKKSGERSPAGFGTGKEYAAHRRRLGLSGGTPAAVSQAKAAGRISPPENGLYNFVVADQEWARNTKSQHRGPEAPPVAPVAHPPTHTAPAAGVDAPAAAPGPPVIPQGETPDRRHWDAVKVYWEAETKRMEAQKMAGGLVERDKAVIYVAGLFRSVRDQVLSIPPRLRTALAGAETPDACESILREELQRALAAPDFASGLAS